MTLVSRLRAHTAPMHETVDQAFGAYDLTAREDYRRFLVAHAVALPAVEQALAAHQDLPPWRERSSLLAADLGDLDEPMPPPLPFVLPSMPGAAWGALYVIDGSRLGGAMLARTVSSALPARYLNARHARGDWRAFLDLLDAQGEARGAAWIDAAIAGAGACFALYRDGAQGVRDLPDRPAAALGQRAKHP